ncbi:MAG: hypothetical protein VB082_10670 [Christensenella sp.]|nr:hypothetical protein [Christensenella sp.]
MRELIGYLTEDGYQPETSQEYAKRLAEEKQQQAAMNNAGYANDVYGSVNHPKYGGTKKSSVMNNTGYANENGVPEKLVAGGGTFWGGGDSRPQASVSDGSAKASNRASWDDGSVDKPRYGGTVAKKPQVLPGLTPIGAQTGNPFSLPQTPSAVKNSVMNNAGYANDVYGNVDKPRYGGTVAKKPQMLPGLTPPGAENIRGGSTQNGTGMLYNKNNPNKMTKNGINLGASAYNYHKGQNGVVNMSDVQASSVTKFASSNNNSKNMEYQKTGDLAEEQEKNSDSIKRQLDETFENEPGAWFVTHLPMKKDWVGQIIAGRWASGKGEDMVIDHDEDWSNYVKTDPVLATSTQAIVKEQCEGMKPGETREIACNEHVSFIPGNDLTGVNLLGGSNKDAGNYVIKGTVTMDEKGNIITNLEYCFNDIVDPNANYSTDTQNSNLVDSIPGVDPKPYHISIVWNDQSIIPADSQKGSGWLGQDGLGTEQFIRERHDTTSDRISDDELEEIDYWGALYRQALDRTI